MPNQTSKSTVVTQAIYDIVDAAKLTVDPQGDPVNVFYGDIQKIPSYPTVCVFSGPKTREHSGSLQRYRVGFTTILQCYICKYEETSSVTRKKAELFGEAIEDLIHNSLTLVNRVGSVGVVVDGFIMSSEPGYSVRGTTKIQAVRLTHTAFNQTNIPDL
jgi:hypothetical protein